MKRFWRLIIVAILLCSRPSQASMFGEENVQLAALVAQGVEQAEKFRKTLDYMKQTTSFARDTAGFARESVQLSRNVQSLVQDPGAFFANAMHAWHSEFPELQDILEHAYDIRQSIDAASHPEDMPLYDPYAYVRAFDSLHSMNTSAFEVWAHAVDNWGVSPRHDAALKVVQIEYDASLANFKKLADAINTTGISPVEASIYTAQATTSSAMAQVQAAATLEHINRTMELVVTGQAAQGAKDQALLNVQAAGAAELHMRSWRLDPGGSRQLSHERH